MSKEDEKPDLEVLTKSLLDVAVESWRFGRVFDRLLPKLDARGTRSVSRAVSLVSEKAGRLSHGRWDANRECGGSRF